MKDTEYTKKISKILVTLVLVSIFACSLFSQSLEKIIETSKEDPEFAWDMYLSFLQSATITTENESEIENIGKMIHSKRVLKEYEFAVKEDINGLIDFLKNNQPSLKMKTHIFNIFTDLDSILENFDPKNPEILYLLSLYGNYSYRELFEKIYNYSLENPQDLEKFYNIFSTMKKENFFSASMINLLEERTSEKLSKEEKAKLSTVYKFFAEKGFKDKRLEKTLGIKSINLIKLNLEFLSGFKDYWFIYLLAIGIIILFAIKITRFYIFYALGLKRLAVSTYKKIVEKDPLDERKRLKLAQLYESVGMYEEAMNEYNFLSRIKLE